jgi:hypothetical protein
VKDDSDMLPVFKIFKFAFIAVLVFALMGLIASKIRNDAEIGVLHRSATIIEAENKRLADAARAHEAGCADAKSRAASVLLLLQNELTAEASKYEVKFLASELASWIRYCEPEGYQRYNRLLGAVQGNNFISIRKELSEFRDGTVLVEK